MWKRIFSVAVALSWMVAGSVQAAPIVSGSTLIHEDNGLPGVCSAPCYVATLDYEVWLPGDMDNPLPLAGNQTYLYQLSNLTAMESAATVPSPGVPITEFELIVEFSFVTDAGSIPDGGIAPTDTTISPLNVVSWSFPLSSSCPDCLIQGEISDPLFIHSPLLPDLQDGSLTAIFLDASFTTVGPGKQIPEPGAALVFAAALALVGAVRRRRR